jgi:hypothetical protein
MNKIKSQNIDWKFNIHVPITKKQLLDSLNTYINRGGLMIGPSDIYGVVKTFKPNTTYCITEKHGIATVSTKKGKNKIIRHNLTNVISIPKTKIEGKWYSTRSQNKPSWYNKEIKKLGSANVFDSQNWGNTIMTVDFDTLEIPLVDALEYQDKLLEYNNCKIIKFGDPLPTSEFSELLSKSKVKNEVMLLSYTFKKDYINDILMNKENGVGFFVESHPFPHFAFAADKTTEAVITLGKKSHNNENVYDFTSFKLPYGYVLYVSENTIHTDALTVGTMAISVNASEDKADTAFIRTKKGGIVSIVSVSPKHCVENDEGEIVYVNKKGKFDTCVTRNKTYYYKSKKSKSELPFKTCGSRYKNIETKC